MSLAVEAILDLPVLEVAPRLLGTHLSTRFEGTTTRVMVNEVEAYVGDEDPASHAFRGQTPRNQSMFEERGTLYVYRSYGIHWCMNVVVGDEGVAHAVLLRSGIPLEGRATMVCRRGRDTHVADGPGKLCEALGVTGDHDGSSVLDGPVRLAAGELSYDYDVTITPRVGISKATDRRWRWVASASG